MLIILLWAAMLGALPSIAIRFLGGAQSSKRITLICTVPACLAMILCIFSLSIYFYLYDYVRLDPKAQLRGAIAGPALRVAIFWGLWLVIDVRTLRSSTQTLMERVRSLFEDGKEPGDAG
jgi:hypothetical protein